MPKKADAFQPRIYSKKEGKYLTHYIKYWVGGKRKFHKTHDGKCDCGKPRPNRPCPHLKAAQEVLQTFEAKMSGKALDAPIAYLISEWEASDHQKRTEATVNLYMNTYKLFQAWCDSQGIKTTSELLEGQGRHPMADFKRYLESTPYQVKTHTPESQKMLRNIDYIVRRDKIRRDSDEFLQPEYQELVLKMEAAMQDKTEHYSKATIHRIFRELNVLFRFGFYKKLMASNPLNEEGKPSSLKLVSKPEDDSKRNALTVEERKVLLDDTEGDIHDMVVVLLYAGLRIGELINLHWGAHIKDGWIDIAPVNGWKPKWGKTRTIPMHKRVKEALSRQRVKHPQAEYVFMTTGRSGSLVKYGKWNIQHRFREIFDRLELVGIYGTKVTVHSLRHSFISTLLANGVSIIKVKEMAGHKDIRTTMRYAHDLDKRDASVMDNIE